MAVLGIVLVLIGVIIGLLGFLLAGSVSTPLTLQAGWLNIDMTVTSIFIMGIATAVFVATGLWLVKYGAKRGLASRRERRQLEKDAKVQEEQLAATRARLEQERARSGAGVQAPQAASSSGTPRQAGGPGSSAGAPRPVGDDSAERRTAPPA